MITSNCCFSKILSKPIFPLEIVNWIFTSCLLDTSLINGVTAEDYSDWINVLQNATFQCHSFVWIGNSMLFLNICFSKMKNSKISLNVLQIWKFYAVLKIYYLKFPYLIIIDIFYSKKHLPSLSWRNMMGKKVQICSIMTRTPQNNFTLFFFLILFVNIRIFILNLS